MAAWRSMADDEYDVQESYGQHVTSEAFYPEWGGEAEGGLGSGSAAPAPSETLDLEAVAAAGLHDALMEIAALLDRAAAA